MHVAGSMKYWVASGLVEMQSTGQTSVQEASFTPLQGSVMMNGIRFS